MIMPGDPAKFKEIGAEESVFGVFDGREDMLVIRWGFVLWGRLPTI